LWWENWWWRGTLVVEAGTQLHAEGTVVLEPTMQLEVVLLDPDALEDGKVQVIVCTSLISFSCAVQCSVLRSFVHAVAFALNRCVQWTQG
jgi:hypothetical protein